MRRRGGARRHRAAVADFGESIVGDVAALRDALARDDVEAVFHQAHRIQGASRTVGAVEVAGLAARLEELAAEGSAAVTSLGGIAGELAAAVARVEAVLAHPR